MKYRARTFEGIAKAMVDQWGQFVLDELNIELAKQLQSL